MLMRSTKPSCIAAATPARSRRAKAAATSRASFSKPHQAKNLL